MMMGLAIGIPLLVAISVALAYRSFGVEARFQGLVSQAARQVSLAQAAGDDLVEARVHWEAALTYGLRRPRISGWGPEPELRAATVRWD